MDSVREKKVHISSKNRENDTERRMRRGWWEEKGKREKREKGDTRHTSVFLAAVRTHNDRTAKLIKVNSYFFPCFVTEIPSEHNQTIKRAFVVSNKTFENALGWLTRVL